MKVHVEEDQAENFKPITLTLTITSRDELRALWHRLDVGGQYLVKRYSKEPQPTVCFPKEWLIIGCQNDCTEPLFRAIDMLTVERNLRGGGKVGH